MPDNEALSAPEEVKNSSVHLRGELSKPPSRALWLLKWFLAIPHLLVVIFLGLAVLFLTIFVFFAIIFTGRYPRKCFDFVVGVFRWGWRVGFYAFSVLGTDKYPPFSLKPRDDYPADLHIDYPERLSQWLPLVKWFLAIPHYFVLVLFFGFSTEYNPSQSSVKPFQNSYSIIETHADDSVIYNAPVEPFQNLLLPLEVRSDKLGKAEMGVKDVDNSFPGLNQVLVLIALFALLFTGRYHRDIFRLVMGMNRWRYRVSAYVLLLTDEYPHFRLMD